MHKFPFGHLDNFPRKPQLDLTEPPIRSLLDVNDKYKPGCGTAKQAISAHTLNKIYIQIIGFILSLLIDFQNR